MDDIDTVLAETSEYLVEYAQSPRGLLTIANKATGQCIGLTGKRVAGEFRDCLKTHSPERVIQTFIRIGRNDWKPLYKPGVLLARN